MPTIFTLPQGFDPTEFLPPGLHREADSARWFMYIIVNNTMHGNLDYGWARLDSRIMRHVMGKRTTDIVHALEDHGAIERSVGYAVGRECRGYRLALRFADAAPVRVRARDPFFIDRYERKAASMEAKEIEAWQPVHHALRLPQARVLTIDAIAAEQALARLPEQSRPGQQLLISDLADREYPFCWHDRPRVQLDNHDAENCTSCRPTVDGEMVKAVDICCAQPSLLASLHHDFALDDVRRPECRR